MWKVEVRVGRIRSIVTRAYDFIFEGSERDGVGFKLVLQIAIVGSLDFLELLDLIDFGGVLAG